MTGKTNLPLSIHEYELHSSECSTKFELTIQHAINTYAYLTTYIKKQKLQSTLPIQRTIE